MCKRRIVIVSLLVLCGLGLVAWRDTASPALGRESLAVPGLTRDVSILHVSDLHGARFGEAQSDVAALLGDERFDAIVLNGDLVPSFEADPAAAWELFDVLRAHTDVIVFSAGNHDPGQLMRDLRDAGGVPTWELPGEALIATDAGGVLLTSPARATETTAAALVLISHAPITAGDIASQGGLAGTRVYLFGHTHGGQVRLPILGAIWAPEPLSLDGASPRRTIEGGLLPDLRGRFVRGLYRTDGAWVHVSPGLGTHRLPLRLFNRAELTVVRLTPAQ